MSLRLLCTVLCLFALSPAQATLLSGQVTDSVSGNPLAGASINAFDLFSHYSGSTSTDANGNYQLDITGNPQVTAAFAGYVSQTQFVNDATTLNFALVQAGTVMGTVNSAGSAVAGAQVYLYDAQTLNSAGAALSSDDGSYRFDVLPGQYAVCVIDSDDGYADQCYSGAAYPGADGNLDFTPVNLASGQTVANVDLDLVAGVSLSGTLRDSYFNVPIREKVTFTLYSSTLRPIASIDAVPDATGAYTIQGLTPGSYYIEAAAYQISLASPPNNFYPPKLYGGTECTPACTFSAAALTAVPTGGLAGVDFDLFPGRMVTGRVTDAQTGAGLPNVMVEAGEEVCGFLFCVTGTATTDANGNYRIAHLDGRVGVHVSTVGANGYVDILWPNSPCAPQGNCVFSFDTTNAVQFNAPDQTVGGIDLALPRPVFVSGQVTRSDFATPLPGANVGIYFDDGVQGPKLQQILTTDVGGNYQSSGWVAGTYYVAAWDANITADCQFFGGAPCTPYLYTLPTPTPAQAITIAAPGTYGGFDVALDPSVIFRNGFE